MEADEKLKNMNLQSILSEIDFLRVFNVITGVIAFFVAYLKILPLLPKTSSKLLSDFDVLDKAEKLNIENSLIIRESIEREILRKYKKPFKIYDYGSFSISIILLLISSYIGYSKIIDSDFNSGFFFNLLLFLISLTLLMESFSEKKTKDKNENKIIQREAVFKFAVYSWKEIIYGLVVTSLFGFWTYHLSFNNGIFNFNWWAIITLILLISGLTIIRGAFKEKKESGENSKGTKNEEKSM